MKYYLLFQKSQEWFLGPPSLIFSKHRRLALEGKAAEIRNEWSYTSTPLCYHCVNRGNFNIIFTVFKKVIGATYIYIYIYIKAKTLSKLSPQDTVLFEKLVSPRLFKKFPPFCGNPNSITVLAVACHCVCPEPDEFNVLSHLFKIRLNIILPSFPLCSKVPAAFSFTPSAKRHNIIWVQSRKEERETRNKVTFYIVP